MLPRRDASACRELQSFDERLRAVAHDLALFLVYDRPERVKERPGLARTYFAQRCVSDLQLEQTVDAFRSVGSYVELFAGEIPFIKAAATGRLRQLPREFKVVYNGIEGGIGNEGFAPGRKALLPAVADAYGLVCANSNAYACALARHKFHYFTILRGLGVCTPHAWHFRSPTGWVGNCAPPVGTKVIAKSTYESWSVGVTEDSIFVVDDSADQRVQAIERSIGQPVTVQEFVPGREVCVPVLMGSEGLIVTPVVEVILAKAPHDAEAVMTIDDNITQSAVSYETLTEDDDVVDQLTIRAADVFNILELDGFARIDFRVDKEGTAWVTDVGVSPGLGMSSAAFHSFRDMGFDHSSFLRIVIGATLCSRGLLASSRARTQPRAS